jgi:pimeloyl-ACP methyl ester carboxylesterase
MAQSPNTYPSWLAPQARVAVVFSDKFMTNFPSQYLEVGPPEAQLCYRVVKPAEYGLKVSSSNWFEHGRAHFKFSFGATVPAETNVWTVSPRGTVILLHGYGLAQFAMAPWALRLAQDGWSCVVVDLRGHGKSTGRRIYYGAQEWNDLSQLLDELLQAGQLSAPVAAFGESYGAALALRWKATDPRVSRVVAVAPYPVLSNAVMNICNEYTDWFPQWLLKSGLRKLPSVLGVEGSDLDTATVLARRPVAALFVAGTQDKVAPPTDVLSLYEKAAPGSEWITVPGATHEALPFYFHELAPAVLSWLEGTGPTNEISALRQQADQAPAGAGDVLPPAPGFVGGSDDEVD